MNKAGFTYIKYCMLSCDCRTIVVGYLVCDIVRCMLDCEQPKYSFTTNHINHMSNFAKRDKMTHRIVQQKKRVNVVFYYAYSFFFIVRLSSEVHIIHLK